MPRIGALLLQDLTPDRLSVLYRDVASGGRNGRALAPNMVRRIHASLHRAFRDAVAWGYMLRNPAAVATKPKSPSPGSAQMRIWTAEQLRGFLEHVAEGRLFGAWRLAASTGMRRSEVLGLRWIDVDFDADQLARQTYTNAGAATMFDERKTSRSKRTVALDIETVRTMRSWWAKQLAERLLWAEAWEDCGLVFTRENGAAIHPDAFSARWGKVRDTSGLPSIRFHDLRHTHASLALQAGVPAKVVSERMGHATVAFTLDVYSHTIPSLHRDAAEQIAALLV